MKQLTRFQMAAVKRTAQNTKKLVSTKDKIVSKIKELGEELAATQAQIDAWEEPIKIMTGGYTSEDVIKFNGIIPDADQPAREYEAADYAEAADAQLN